MQLSKTIVPASLAVAASAAANVTITTQVVVTDYTTYCPLPTTVVVNNKTITVTEATTITITGPCTIPTTYVTTTAAPTSTYANITTHVGGANKMAAGAVAGFAAVAAALL